MRLDFVKYSKILIYYRVYSQSTLFIFPTLTAVLK